MWIICHFWWTLLNLLWSYQNKGWAYPKLNRSGSLDHYKNYWILLPLQTSPGQSACCWLMGITCSCHFGVLSLLSDCTSSSWEKPAAHPHYFNMVLHRNLALHFPVSRKTHRENKHKFACRHYTPVQGREQNPYLGASVPGEQGCWSQLLWGAGLHGNATAQPLHCASALIGNARSHPSSKACWKHSRLPGLGTVLPSSWLRNEL